LPAAAIVRAAEAATTIAVVLAEIVVPTASIAVPAAAGAAVDQRETDPRRSQGRASERATEEATLEVLTGQAVPAFGIRVTYVTVEAGGGSFAPRHAGANQRQGRARGHLEYAASIRLSGNLPRQAIKAISVHLSRSFVISGAGHYLDRHSEPDESHSQFVAMLHYPSLLAVHDRTERLSPVHHVVAPIQSHRWDQA
jgi:hypothetical protein